jgi:hypothetical protein
VCSRVLGARFDDGRIGADLDERIQRWVQSRDLIEVRSDERLGGNLSRRDERDELDRRLVEHGLGNHLGGAAAL